MEKKLKERMLEEMKAEARNSGTITNWHMNDEFLMWCDEFFPGVKTTNKLQRKFTYYANILVKRGFLNKAVKIGIGPGGLNEFGCRTQTIWGWNYEKEGVNEV